MTHCVQKTFRSDYENFLSDQKCKQLSRVKIDDRSIENHFVKAH